MSAESSDRTLRAAARRLEAERAPLPRASAEEARAAFPAPAYDAQVSEPVEVKHLQVPGEPVGFCGHRGDGSYVGGNSLPMATSVATCSACLDAYSRPSPQDVAREVAAQLTRSGVPGDFVATPMTATVRLDWQGAAHHRGEAERALMDALQARGYAAGALPGMGVRVTVLPEPKAPPAGSQAPARASRPAAVHAAARDLSGPRGLGPVAPAEMDPHECAGSLMGRVLRYRAEV